MAHWALFFQRRLHELMALALGLFGGYLWLALDGYDPEDPGWTHTRKAEQVHNLAGSTGAWFSDVGLTAFGYMAYLFPVLCGLWALRIFFTRHHPQPLSILNFMGRLVGLVVTLLSGTALSELHLVAQSDLPISTGGALGRSLGQWLTGLGLNAQSKTLLLSGFLILGITLLLSLSWFGLMELIGKIVLDFLELLHGFGSRLLGLDRPKKPSTMALHSADHAFDSAPGHHAVDDLHLDAHFLAELESQVAQSSADADHLTAFSDENLAVAKHAVPSQAPKKEKATSEQVRAKVPVVHETDFDEHGQLRDWKEEPVIRSVSPWVRPTAQRISKTASSPSSLHFSARDDESLEDPFSENVEDAFQPEIRDIPTPKPAVSSVATLPATPPENQEDVVSLAARIIQADRRGLGSGSEGRPMPRTPSVEPLQQLDDWTELGSAPVEPEPMRLMATPPKNSQKPAFLTAQRDGPEDSEEDFWAADDENGRREPSLTLSARPLAASLPSAPMDVPPASLTPVKPIPSAFSHKESQQNEDGWMPEGVPPISLLDPPEQSAAQYTEESLMATSRLLEQRLKEFGVDVKVEEVYPGPVITRFEIQPAPGIKSSRISNLAKDLARSLAVTSVRVVEVIPGRTTVGIEIPNEQRQIVRLSEVLSSNAYADAHSPVMLALGHDISGQPVLADLARMPHLLVAGTTGSGKSVGVNAMILSILLKSTPDEARLIMIDPKMLELSIYEGIPHLLCPVVTDMKEAANALRWCVAEMERRYKLMSALGVRNLAGFNRKVKEAEDLGQPLSDPLFCREHPQDTPPFLQALPTIVVIIDEFADMMMIVGKKVEELIARIAQKARAAGIHLVLATQRPSVDVITGLIKANIPTRIAFQVSSKVDSRTILDAGGAEQLLGHGDMLYMPPGTAHPIRVHGAFVSDDEVHRVVEAWKQRGLPHYVEDILGGEDANAADGGSGADGGEGSEEDPLYDEAVRFVTESRRASISAVQRKLRIGYNRAARMIEAMEAAGVVTVASANGSREVIAPSPLRD